MGVAVALAADVQTLSGKKLTGDIVGLAIKLPAVVGPVNLGNVITIADVKLRPAASFQVSPSSALKVVTSESPFSL